MRDHGIGLKPGEEKLVFNRFWRADPSRARQTGGTGLGLSISLEDARLHGGWLEAWGAPGQGAQFRLTLPVRAGDRLVSSPLRLVPDDATFTIDPVRPVAAIASGRQPVEREPLAIETRRCAVTRRLLALLLVIVSLLAFTGCGLPEHTTPIVVGDAPREGGPADDDIRSRSTAKDAPSGQALVERYLKAAAGANESATDRKPFEEASTRLKDFLTPDSANRWKPGQSTDLKVVQVASRPAARTAAPDVERVDVDLRPVGTAQRSGQIVPPAIPCPTACPTGEARRGRRPAPSRILDPPDGMLLSSAGLQRTVRGPVDLLLGA